MNGSGVLICFTFPHMAEFLESILYYNQEESAMKIAEKLGVGRKNNDGIPDARKIEKIMGRDFLWINLQNPDRGYMEKLAKEYNLNALNVEDCLTKFELPKLDSYDDHIFLILHFPPLGQRHSIPRHSQLSIFMGKDFVITVHQGDLKPLADLVYACKKGVDPERNSRLQESTGVLVHEIIDVLVDDLMHTMRRIISNIDDIEEGAFDARRSVARRISLLRREITMLRRIVNPLKRVVTETGRHVSRFSVTKDLTLYYDDILDHVEKVIESLEESKETMEIYKDTDFMLSTEKTNRVLAVLTIIFTLAIPATVIGTFYGMNVNLPGDSEVTGSYVTFAGIILASVIPAGFMLVYFKKAGWLS